MQLEIAPYESRLESELVSLWRESFEFGVGIRDPRSLEQQVHNFRNQVLPACEVRVALDQGRLCGFVASTRDRVVQLHVDVHCHRRGVGTAMLNWAKHQSSGSLHVYTFARNGIARAFYERRGFIVERYGYEPDWQLDDVLYRWQAEL